MTDEPLKIGDFVYIAPGIGMAPEFGYIRREGLVSKYNIPIWIVQTGPGKFKPIPKDFPLVRYPVN